MRCAPLGSHRLTTLNRWRSPAEISSSLRSCEERRLPQPRADQHAESPSSTGRRRVQHSVEPKLLRTFQGDRSMGGFQGAREVSARIRRSRESRRVSCARECDEKRYYHGARETWGATCAASRRRYACGSPISPRRELESKRNSSGRRASLRDIILAYQLKVAGVEAVVHLGGFGGGRLETILAPTSSEPTTC